MSRTDLNAPASESMLLVMDCQAPMLGAIADADSLLSRTAQALATARTRGAHVGYLHVAFEDSDYDKVPAANKVFAPLAQARFLRAGTPESQVHPDVAPLAGDTVVRKTRVGAFSTTDLEEQLRSKGVRTLFLAGISTSGVVLSTVRDAADRDYRLVVLSDATADPDPEVHRLLIEKVFPVQADVLTTADIASVLS